jgi:hypothetical protein
MHVPGGYEENHDKSQDIIYPEIQTEHSRI